MSTDELDLTGEFQDVKDIQSVEKLLGEMMFTPKDIQKVPMLLDKLLRSIFVDRYVTKQYFKKSAIAYAKNVFHFDRANANTFAQNTIKALKKGDVSSMIFTRSLRIIGLYPLNMISTFADESGIIYQYDLNALQEKLKTEM